MRGRKRIIVFAIGNIANCGDEILADAAEWLFRRSAPEADLDIVRAQFHPRGRDMGFRMTLSRWARQLRHAVPKSKLHAVVDWSFRILYEKYFERVVRGADAVVFAVGMLKYATQDHSYLFSMVTRTATRLGVPVMFNAGSVAKPDEGDWRCRQLVSALNEPSVKMISTRDGDEGLNLLERFYCTGGGRDLRSVGDPALWVPEIYGVSAKRESGIIGVNLPRFGLYGDYNGSVDDERLMSFYVNLVGELGRLGAKWKLFCNGMEADWKFGKALAARAGLGEDCILPRPSSARELVAQVSGFSVVFGARLHACIVAHSLGIPVVGLRWDDKLDRFASMVGIGGGFLGADQLDGVAVARRLVGLVGAEVDLAPRDFWRRRTAEAVSDFLAGSVVSH